MSSLGFIVNIDRCVGCNACVIACKAFHSLEPDMRRRKVTSLNETITGDTTRSYISISCNHCEMPECAAVCPVGAYDKLENGIVDHDPEICVGCRLCLNACPYEAPCYNSVTNKVDKCDMCKERLKAGEKPVCVASCPMGALETADMDSIGEAAYTKTIDGFPDISKTGPNVRFVPPKSNQQSRIS